MSYSLSLVDPVTLAALELDEPHHMRGGTYPVGGSREARLNVTYNYSSHYYRLFPTRPASCDCDQNYSREADGSVGGIRSIYGLTGAQSIPVLSAVIDQLKDDTAPSYWTATEGNAKRALMQLRALAHMRPDGVWRGD